MDEFDRLLAQQTASNDITSTASSSSAVSETSALQKIRSLLSCSSQNFDPMVELTRTFGGAAVKAYENESKGSGRGTARARMRNSARNPNMRLRCVLIQPKPEWPPINQTFLGMSMEDHHEEGKGKVCEWKHSRAYKEAQYNYLEATRSFDPNSLYTLYRLYPWHISNLLQLSEVQRHQGDLGQAGDFIARALFAFERSANPSFLSSLTSNSGPIHVDYSLIENREFYLAAHRHVNYLGRRGTWRTALEWTKLLLAMAAPADPHAVLLWADFLAIKSRNHAWLLEMDEAYAAAGVDLDWSVGWQYAKALAHRALEAESKSGDDHSKSDAALGDAIAKHPVAVPILLKKVGIDLPIEALKSPKLQIATSYSDTSDDEVHVHLLSHLYAARSESLWKEGDNGKWLLDTFQKAWPSLEDQPSTATAPDFESLEIHSAIFRHILISDIPDALRQQLLSLIPPALTAQSELLNASDPFPPAEGSFFDDVYFSDLHGRGSNGSARRGNGDASRMDLLRVVQEAQDALPEDQREGFLVELMQRMLPGGWAAQQAGEQVDGAGADHEADNDAEEAGPPPAEMQGMLQRVFNFLHPGGRPPQ